MQHLPIFILHWIIWPLNCPTGISFLNLKTEIWSLCVMWKYYLFLSSTSHSCAVQSMYAHKHSAACQLTPRGQHFPIKVEKARWDSRKEQWRRSEGPRRCFALTLKRKRSHSFCLVLFRLFYGNTLFLFLILCSDKQKDKMEMSFKINGGT